MTELSFLGEQISLLMFVFKMIKYYSRVKGQFSCSKRFSC